MYATNSPFVVNELKAAVRSCKPDCLCNLYSCLLIKIAPLQQWCVWMYWVMRWNLSTMLKSEERDKFS